MLYNRTIKKKVEYNMSTIAICVDDELKEKATELYKELGLDMSTAVKLFLTQSVKKEVFLLRLKILLQMICLISV